jgi:riboflavin synthase
MLWQLVIPEFKMFTGIVEEIGTVRQTSAGQLTISADKVLEGSQLGDSIAVNGTCLTINKIEKQDFSIEVMPETLRLTNLGQLRSGNKVNLERALCLGGRLGGHLVQGHVDATGRVLMLTPESDALKVRYWAPPEVMHYIVSKGFIAVDGVSLTVVDCDVTSFQVSLVGFTRSHTILAQRRPGDLVNLEVDIIAKYVERLTGKDKSGITLDFLASHGFLT